MSDTRANKWLKENRDKEIIDIQMSAGGFAVIYEEHVNPPTYEKSQGR